MPECPRCGALDSIRLIKVLDGGNPGHIITVMACSECDAIVTEEKP